MQFVLFKKKKKKKIHGFVKRQILCQSLINASISRAPLIKRYFMKSHTLAKKHKFKQKNETFLMIKETSISKHLQIHSFLCFTTHSRCHAAFFYSVSNKQQAVDVTLSSEADVGRGKTQACIDLVCVESRAKTEKLWKQLLLCELNAHFKEISWCSCNWENNFQIIFFSCNLNEKKQVLIPFHPIRLVHAAATSWRWWRIYKMFVSANFAHYQNWSARPYKTNLSVKSLFNFNPL